MTFCIAPIIYSQKIPWTSKLYLYQLNFCPQKQWQYERVCCQPLTACWLSGLYVKGQGHIGSLCHEEPWIILIGLVAAVFQ